MDSFVLTPVPHSDLIHVAIADGSEGHAHTAGVHCKGVKSALSVVRVILWQDALDSLPEGTARDQVAILREAYAKRNPTVLA